MSRFCARWDGTAFVRLDVNDECLPLAPLCLLSMSITGRCDETFDEKSWEEMNFQSEWAWKLHLNKQKNFFSFIFLRQRVFRPHGCESIDKKKTSTTRRDNLPQHRRDLLILRRWKGKPSEEDQTCSGAASCCYLIIRNKSEENDRELIIQQARESEPRVAENLPLRVELFLGFTPLRVGSSALRAKWNFHELYFREWSSRCDFRDFLASLDGVSRKLPSLIHRHAVRVSACGWLQSGSRERGAKINRLSDEHRSKRSKNTSRLPMVH